MKNHTFATAINCIDGRVQEPVATFLKSKFGVDYVDMITEPGVDKVLSQYSDKPAIESVRKRVEISIKKHNSRIITIVGHYDCAANPVDKNTHFEHLKKAASKIAKWGYEAVIVGIWVNKKLQAKQV